MVFTTSLLENRLAKSLAKQVETEKCNNTHYGFVYF